MKIWYAAIQCQIARIGHHKSHCDAKAHLVIFRQRRGIRPLPNCFEWWNLPEDRKMCEIRLTVYATEKQAKEIKDRTSRLPCPDPEHALPCPAP
jgi:hypothetical protein